MSVRTKRNNHPPRWDIFRLANRAVHLGSVLAPDEKQAIKRAIEELPVTNPHHQQLVARKVEARS
jgi:hypothetical protein